MGNTFQNGHGRATGFASPPRATPVAPVKPVEPAGEWRIGTLKFYDPDRKFGFIRDDDGFDIMLHWRCLKRSSVNARELVDDMRLRFKSQPVPGRSPEAVIVRFA